jgi:radical SAM superfamily enzyme YgiQ (UPF0313 family)
MNSSRQTVLLVNPWIYDFAAFDFWNKPLGLLTIGAVLDQLGYDVQLLDCLDRFDPDLPEPSAVRPDGTGKFFREPIDKPAALQFVPRYYCRYGLPLPLVQEKLAQMPEPRVILITSFMSYWYPAVADIINLLRTRFPEAVIVLGGIYATLYPEHAARTMRPDYLIQGEGEEQAVRLVARLCTGPGQEFRYDHLDELPFPLYTAYVKLRSAAMLTSRGCPFQCSFCASRRLFHGYRRKSVARVLQEAEYLCQNFPIRDVAFYDDALLFQPEEYIKPILRNLLKEGIKLSLHTPNGLQLRYIDAELAELMHATGFATVRLSFESTEPARQQNKVNNADLATALLHLHQAGFHRRDIGVYTLLGLPEQTPEEVRHTIDYVHDLGAKVNLASFSPIAGTADARMAETMGFWSGDEDLLLTNNSIFPIWRKKYDFALCEEIVNYARLKNSALFT